MEDWITGVIFTLFVIIPCWLALSHKKEVQKQVEAWPELARHTGLTFDANIFGSPLKAHYYPGLRGEYRGRSLVAKIVHDSDHFEPPNTLISLNVQNCACLLSVQARKFRDYIHRITGVSSGNLDFDRLFSVAGSPREYVQGAVELIAQSDPRLLTWIMRNSPSIELKEYRLTCWQNGELTNMDDQNALLNLLCDLAELAEKMGSEDVQCAEVGRKE